MRIISDRAANQKQIIIHKKTYRENFTVIGNDEWIEVAKIAGSSKSVLITYLYLMNNKDGFPKLFSSKDMSNIFGGDEKTWRRALNTLIEEGYIVHKEGEAKNNYHFYPTPRKEETKVKVVNVTDFMLMDSKEQEQYYNDIYFAERNLTEEENLILEIVEKNNMLKKWKEE